jgi:TetR/AcrR family transcriptional regulator, fatty acid metabolism regulator protein
MAYRTTPKMADRKQARRLRFLETAIRLFGAQGFHATTVPMIVEEAGSSTGSFYFYFRNKEEVFVAALKWLAERIARELDRAIGAEVDPVRQMEAAVKGLFLFLAASPAEARILIVESSGLGPRIEAVRKQVLDSHATSVERALLALAPALPGVVDPAIAARCWVGAVYQAAHWWLAQPADCRSPAENVATEVARFNLQAIGAGPEATRIAGR